jgi:general secretion pathway protein G
MLILAAISISLYRTALLNSREATLRTNLAAMRDAIDQYSTDRKMAPQALNDLVESGYVRQLPIDPITNSNTSWKPVIDDGGITDLHSGSSSTSSDGTAYNAW